MKIIIISSPKWLLNEANHVQRLLDAGLESFHLRKPMAKEEMMRSFLTKFSPENRRKIKIHGNYRLAAELELGGIHLTESARRIMPPIEKEILMHWQVKHALTVSTSVHQPADLKELKQMDYAFCSPVFDSISKEGYGANPVWQKRQNQVKADLIALGGIDTSRLGDLVEWGYDGLAMLGAIWKEPEMSGDVFVRMKEEVGAMARLNRVDNGP